MKISNDSVVSMHYTLTNDTGEVLDSSAGREPLAYLQGHGNIIPGLENALVDKVAGDKLKVTVKPEEGYGVRNEGMVQEVDLANFQEPNEVKEGIRIRVETNQGVSVAVVTKVDGDKVTLDMNHPLAGETLHFDVEITDVRAASQDELAHGHVHGPGGHQH